MSWYVLYTKPRAEKRVARDLEQLDMEVYCPVITEVRQWSDRKKKVVSPLFRSYIFVNLEEKERDKVFEVQGVVRYLYWLGKPAVVKDQEIETIRAWLSADITEEVSVEHLSPGEIVTITSGPFSNKQAIIRKIGKKRMHLILPQLGFVVKVKTSDVITRGPGGG